MKPSFSVKVFNLTGVDINNVSIERIETGEVSLKGISISILRLDKIHTVISGNKWFKLKYYFQYAKDEGYDSIITFGGAFSNHIAASSLAASIHQFKSIGIIRGEEPKQWSHTLLEAQANGMQLHFVSRAEYDDMKRASSNNLFQQFDDSYIIPEGGYGEPGVKGAEDILKLFDTSSFTHIVSAVGTGTTIAGIIKTALPQQQVIGISAMKNNTALDGEIKALLSQKFLHGNFTINHNYHFGGYAKHTPELLCWMNDFFSETGVPLDFVYTGKTMFAIMDLIKNGDIPSGSNVLMIHTGGLQGNLSTKPGVLKF